VSSALQTRLTRQLASRGVKNAKSVADKLLADRGHLKNGKLTKEGQQRQSLGNDGRAKDRAVKRSGGKPSDYSYDPKTNRTRKKS
jgi:hypothetical protein